MNKEEGFWSDKSHNEYLEHQARLNLTQECQCSEDAIKSIKDSRETKKK